MTPPADASALEPLFNSGQSPDAVLRALMPAVSAALKAERCLLFLREPAPRRMALTHFWWDRPEHAFDGDTDWNDEPADLALTDPLFGLALRDPAAVFIDDIETAGPALVNLEYERTYFRHRALIHAPLYHEGAFCGILEPCTFGPPRRWSAEDRALTARVQERAAPFAAAYVAARHKA